MRNRSAKIRANSAKISVAISENRWSAQPSRAALILLLNLLPRAKSAAEIPLTKMPNNYLLWNSTSKERSRARRSLRSEIGEILNLKVEYQKTWENLFLNLELRDDILHIQPSNFLTNVTQEKAGYGHVNLSSLNNFTTAPTIRFACLIAPYLNRWQKSVSFPIDQFRMLIGIEGKYERYQNLKTNILDRITQEFNSTNDGMVVRFDTVRRDLGGKIRDVLIHWEEQRENIRSPPFDGEKIRKAIIEGDGFSQDEEIKYLTDAQAMYGKVIPYFSVRAILDALDILGGDVDMLEKMIVTRYHPEVHTFPRRDSWLKANATVLENVNRAARSVVHDEGVEAMFDEILNSRKRK